VASANWAVISYRDEAKAKESLTALFGKIDKNGNGSLDMAELKRVFGDMAEQFLKFCDQDSDKARYLHQSAAHSNFLLLLHQFLSLFH
jgi:hypothetical protein